MKKISSQYDGIKIMADPAIHEDAFRPVSYTHLTLPTIYSV